MESQYPGNSHKKRVDTKSTEPAPEKKVEKIITGSVTQRKKPLGKRFSEAFVGGDTQGVGSYVLFDVMIPALRDLMADMTTQGVERMLYGEVQTRRGSGGRNGRPSHVSYNRMSGGGSPLGRAGRPDEATRSLSKRSRATHDFDEIVFESRVEAEEVLETLYELVSQFDEANVSDFYQLVGITGSFVDEKWGWTNLRGSRVERIRGGYIITLPKPEPLA